MGLNRGLTGPNIGLKWSQRQCQDPQSTGTWRKVRLGHVRTPSKYLQWPNGSSRGLPDTFFILSRHLPYTFRTPSRQHLITTFWHPNSLITYQTPSRHLIDTLDTFRTPSRHPPDTLPQPPDTFEMPSRHPLFETETWLEGTKFSAWVATETDS